MHRHIALAAALAFALTATPSHATSDTLAAAQKCRKTLSSQGKSYAKKRLSSILGCVDKLLKCEIQLEVDGTNANGCRTKAIDGCTSKIGPAVDSGLSKAATKFDEKTASACLVMGVTNMLSAAAGGLWYGNSANCGTSVDVPTLVACVRGDLEAQVDALVSTAKPRASLLLDNAGLGANFPDLVRPPTVDVVVVATAPASGTLVSPGNINVPAGSALKLSGDSATLPCGGGPNGRLTITVGSGPTAQELQLKEPFGPNEVAIFGPYTASAMLPYTIELKDGSCDDTVSGTVVIP